MIGDERFTRGTVNENLSRGFSLGRHTVKARGFQPMSGITDERLEDLSRLRGKEVTRPSKFNGGIEAPRIGRLEKGDVLFRFSSSTVKGDNRYLGLWWFDMDTLRTMGWAGRMQNSDFTSTARSHLGVLPDWGDMGNLVGGQLTADFWCFRGLTGGVEGPGMKFSGPLRTDVVQLYVPGGLSVAYLSHRHDDVLKSGIV